MTTIFHRTTSALTLGLILIIATVVVLPWNAHAASTTASFDTDTLSSVKTKPTIEGEAGGLKTVRVVIESSTGKSVLKKTVRVNKDAWKLRVTKTLKKGIYTITILESSKKNATVLATSTLIIGSKTSSSSSAKSNGIISVSSLPLLAGGTASQGTSVPVAYLKVQNTSSAAVNLEGFTLKQNGSASAANVIGFSTSDDKGGSRTTIGGIESTKQFKNGSAFVPLVASIAPNQVRIFTIKAIMSSDAGTDLGKQLFLDVSGIQANGGVRASLPIRGAAWTLIR